MIADWETARRTFLWAQTQFTASQKFYLLEERCSDHVEIVRDLSQLYKHLIGFETEPERASKMHRRRADLLEPILDQLSEVDNNFSPIKKYKNVADTLPVDHPANSVRAWRNLF